MTKSEQRHELEMRRIWKKIYRLGDKLAKAQKAKDLVLHELIESVRAAQAMENSGIHSLES